MNARALAPALALVTVLSGCPKRQTAASTLAPPPGARTGGRGFVDWYPDDISLPSGVAYPCDVTALPQDLSGIPAGEQGYVNHVCACFIDVLCKKQVLLTAMGRGDDAAGALASYRTASGAALARLRAEPVPAGLEGFHADAIAAFELHRTFFDQAVPRRAGGASMEDVHTIAEGHAASTRLMSAWMALDARYRGWRPELKDSVYHHLCGFDLF